MRKTIILPLLLCGISFKAFCGLPSASSVQQKIQSTVEKYINDPNKLHKHFCDKGNAFTGKVSFCRSLKGVICALPNDQQRWIYGMCSLLCGYSGSKYASEFKKSHCSKKANVSSAQAVHNLLTAIADSATGQSFSADQKLMISTLKTSLKTLVAHNKNKNKNRYFNSTISNYITQACQGNFGASVDDIKKALSESLN